MLIELKQIPQISTIYRNQIQTSLKKITEILNIYEKHPNFKGKPSFKNGVNIADDTDIVFLNVDKNNRTIKTNLKNIKNQINHSINT